MNLHASLTLRVIIRWLRGVSNLVKKDRVLAMIGKRLIFKLAFDLVLYLALNLVLNVSYANKRMRTSILLKKIWGIDVLNVKDCYYAKREISKF